MSEFIVRCLGSAYLKWSILKSKYDLNCVINVESITNSTWSLQLIMINYLFHLELPLIQNQLLIQPVTYNTNLKTTNLI